MGMMAMTGPGDWLSSNLVTVLGLVLVHFIWQGAVLALLAFAAMSFARKSATRYALGVYALALMLMAPVATFLLVSHPAPAIPDLAIAGDAVQSLTPANLPAVSVFQPPATPTLPGEVSSFLPPDFMPWLVMAWLTGVVLFSLRSTIGYLHLQRMLREHTSVPARHLLEQCRALQRRIRLDRVVIYLECDWLDTPAALGWLKPVVLLPVAALAGLTLEQVEAVIVHELAHIRRLDCLVNLFQILAETLFFYHPAVWWLNRCTRNEREYCCDEIAVSVCGNRIAYARALTLMEEWRSGPGFAMAANAGPLAARVERLLRPHPAHHARVWSAVLLFGAVALSASSIAISLAPDIRESRAPNSSPSAARHLLREMAAMAPAESTDVMPHSRHVRAPVFASVAEPPSFSGLPELEIAAAPAQPSPAEESTPATATEAPTPVVAMPEPAPVALKPNAPFRDEPWAYYGDSSYCKNYSQGIVSRGANQPMVMDTALQQRFIFFYWRCMLASGQRLVLLPNRQPVYAPIGAASPYQPANMSGTWLIASPPWPASRSCTFSQTGNAINGTCKGPEGTGAASGIVDGQQVRWSWKYADNGRNAGELGFIAALSGETAMSGNAILVEQTSPWASRPINQVKVFNATLGGRTVQLASQ
jgi:beta-lactamase regulating signal transducer with metallopeptidase domain